MTEIIYNEATDSYEFRCDGAPVTHSEGGPIRLLPPAHLGMDFEATQVWLDHLLSVLIAENVTSGVPYRKIDEILRSVGGYLA